MSARIAREPKKEVSMISMYVGQVGTFKYGTETVIGLRMYGGFVDLTNANRTWPVSGNEDMQVAPLLPGTIIEAEAQ